MTPGLRLLVLPLATVLVALAGAPSSGADQADKAARLEALYAQYWEEYLKLNPCPRHSRATRATTTVSRLPVRRIPAEDA